MKLSILSNACVALFAVSFAVAGQSKADLAQSLGIAFPGDSPNTVLLTRDGKTYKIDTAAKSVTELSAQTPAAKSNTDSTAGPLFAKNCSGCHGPDGKGIASVGTPNFTDSAFQTTVSPSEMRKSIEQGKDGRMPAWSGKLTEAEITDLVAYVGSLAPGATSPGGPDSKATATSESKPPSTIYHPGDDVLVSLPTGKTTDRHGVYINFTHRFAYDSAVTGTGRGQELFGLDGVALSSFGVRYGITDRLSVSAYRSPSLINRPIQLMAGYNLLEEEKGNPLNLMVRVSIEGQNDFRKNYTENIETILSRSITKKAQVYLVPTVSLNDRRLVSPAGFASDQIADVPGINAFSMGIGVSLDIRPSVALMAEAIPTLLNASDLGIHRPAFSLGIQKKIWRHAFTLALTNSPGTTVSQRAGTRATFLGDPSADTFGGLFVGFNITRQTQ
jgi:mono/diheme cytochrome c family protein